MKKNGFTLIELIVSLTLMSLVLVFMIGLLINLNNKEKQVSESLDIVVDQAIISKYINSDITKNKISSITCADSLTCTIEFNSYSKTLAITENGTTLIYSKNETQELNKKLTKDYKFESITTTFRESDKGTFFKIVIKIKDNPKYDIEAYAYYLK